MSTVDDWGSNSLINRFDVNNREHIAAYIHLDEQGYWPKGFLESFQPPLHIPTGWYMVLQSKMAEAWCKHKSKEAEAKGLPVPNGRARRKG